MHDKRTIPSTPTPFVQEKFTDQILAERRASEISKSDCHLHLHHSAPIEVFRELGGDSVPKIPAHFGDTQGLFSFLRDAHIAHLGTLENTRRVVRAALAHLQKDRVVYAEAGIGITAPIRLGITWAEYAQMIREELTTIAPHSKILFDLGHSRDKGPISRSQIEAALATGLFSAIDLYGDELSAPASAFKEFFEIARSNGLRLKIHVGENQGPAAIREEIREVQPDAIQHGFRAAEDTELMAELADSGTPLNLTLASNIMTGVVDSYEDHPIRKLFDAGVRITLGSDDFGAFGRSISDEYHELYARKIFSSSELEKIRCFGLGFCATKN